MKNKLIFLLLLFTLCLSISHAQVVINTNWKLLDNSSAAVYRNNQNISIRVLASTTATLPTGDVGIILKPFETFSIPADANYYFVKTFNGSGELLIDNFSSLGSVLISAPVEISGTVNTNISTESIGLIDKLTEVSSNTSDVEVKLDSVISNTDNLDTKLDTISNTVSGTLDSNISTESIGLIDKLTEVSSNTSDVESKLDGVISNTDNLDTKLDTITDQIKNSTEIKSRNITLTANVAVSINSTLVASNREGIEITLLDPEKEFWIDFDTDPVIGSSGSRRFGGVYLKLPKSVVPHLISSETIVISVIEGGF